MQIGKITLTDCLSCAGCVTSAESVLVESQSVSMFIDRLSRPGIKVVSVSSQALASLAYRHSLTYQAAFARLSRFLTQLGVDQVLDQQLFTLYTLHTA